jgi:hypothetical protein
LTQKLPNVLDRVQLRRIRRQRQQADVARQPEFAAKLVPARAVQRDDGVRAGDDVRADFCQVKVHRLGVDRRQHESGADATRGADGAKQIGPVVSLVARCAGTATLVGPDVGQAALLADAGFVLPPELDRLATCMLGDGGGDQLGKVFLCAS